LCEEAVRRDESVVPIEFEINDLEGEDGRGEGLEGDAAVESMGGQTATPGGDGAGEPQDETQECRTGPYHFKPKAEQVEDHRLHHHPYRSWCRWCVEGKAHGEHHKPSGRESDVPLVAGDYFYLTDGKATSKSWSMVTRRELLMDDAEIDPKRRSGHLVKCLLLRCHRSKASSVG